jgi:hypothetical protein
VFDEAGSGMERSAMREGGVPGIAGTGAEWRSVGWDERRWKVLGCAARWSAVQWPAVRAVRWGGG